MIKNIFYAVIAIIIIFGINSRDVLEEN